MANGKYLDVVSGVPTQEQAINSSAGAGDADKLIRLDSSGRIDETMMPVGIGADTASIEASENLSAGDFVNVYNDSGPMVRKADATTAGKEANGFVLDAVASGNNATVYFEGQNTQLSGLTPGDVLYLTTTAGTASATAPSGSGNIVQRVAKAVSATSASFEPAQPITLA